MGRNIADGGVRASAEKEPLHAELKGIQKQSRAIALYHQLSTFQLNNCCKSHADGNGVRTTFALNEFFLFIFSFLSNINKLLIHK